MPEKKPAHRSQSNPKRVSVDTQIRKLKRRYPFKIGTEEGISQQQWTRTASTTGAILFDGEIVDSELLYGAKREPVAHRIVVGVGEDVFNKWFKIVNIDKPDDVDLDKQVQADLELPRGETASHAPGHTGTTVRLEHPCPRISRLSRGPAGLR